MNRVRMTGAFLGSVLAVVACGGTPERSGEQVSRAPGAAPSENAAGGVINQTVATLQGEDFDFTAHRGHPILIVNTASECGYTPQYESLQKLYETYGERGLLVVGFPSNDFGNQEPGTAEEIGRFCRLNYGVTFPMMAKVHAKGPDQASIYRTLTTETGEGIRGEVRWNFTKFLIDGTGRVVARFEPAVDPMDPQVTSAVEALLR